MCPANAKNSRGRPNICRYRGLDSGGLLLVALKLISDYLSGWAQLLGSGLIILQDTETNAHMPETSEEPLVLDGKWRDSSWFFFCFYFLVDEHRSGFWLPHSVIVITFACISGS